MSWLIAILAAVPALRIEVDSIQEHHAEALRQACGQVAAALGDPPSPWRLTLRQAASVDEFAAKTLRPRFEAAALVGPVIWLQPEMVLGKFDAAAILRHECVHAWLRAQHVPPLPRVIEESLALWVSGQFARLPPAPVLTAEQLLEAEKTLSNPRNAAALEAALAGASTTIAPILSRWINQRRLLIELKKSAAVPRWDRTLWQQFLAGSQ